MKKKKLIVGVLAASILAGGTFTAGTALGGSSWSVPVISQANTAIINTANKKTTELADKNNISEKMKEMLQPEIVAQQNELERLLEEYYQMKLDGLTETEEYKLVESKIKKMSTDAFNKYKEQIDQAFQ